MTRTTMGSLPMTSRIVGHSTPAKFGQPGRLIFKEGKADMTETSLVNGLLVVVAAKGRRAPALGNRNPRDKAVAVVRKRLDDGWTATLTRSESHSPAGTLTDEASPERRLPMGAR